MAMIKGAGGAVTLSTGTGTSLHPNIEPNLDSTAHWRAARGTLEAHEGQLPSWCQGVDSPEGRWHPAFELTGGVIVWRILVYETRSPSHVERLADV